MQTTTRSRPEALVLTEKPHDLSDEQDSTNNDAAPRPPVRLEPSRLTDCKTHLPLFTVTPKPVRVPCLPFGKFALAVKHSATNAALGTIRFSRSSPDMIWFEVNGRDKALL